MSWLSLTTSLRQPRPRCVVARYHNVTLWNTFNYQPSKPHNVVATTEEGRRLPFPVLQEIYEAYFWFFKRWKHYTSKQYFLLTYFIFLFRCEEYFLCKYQPPEGVHSVGEHVELEIKLYLERFPPQQRYLRRLIFDYLLKRESCITGKTIWLHHGPHCHSSQAVTQWLR